MSSPTRYDAPTTTQTGRRPVSQHIVDKREARKHSKTHIKQIAKSIKQFEFIVPVIVDKDEPNEN